VTKLGPEAQGLVEAGREALRPTEDDRARILAAIGARLPPGALEPHEPAASPPATGSSLGWPQISAIVAGLVASAGVAFFMLRTPGAPAPLAVPAPSPSVAATSASTPAATVDVPDEAADVAVATPSASTSVNPPAARVTSRRSSDRLAEEVALLSRAETELHAGRYAKALGLLDEYARAFPRGTLTQERIGAQVQALCGLGRHAEAETTLRRLSPGSFQETRAREACGIKQQ
jgi:hypothetical protein